MSKTLKRIIALLTCVAIVFSLSLSVLAQTKTVTTKGGADGKATFTCTASFFVSSNVKGARGTISPTATYQYSMDELKIITRLYLNGETSPRTSQGSDDHANSFTFTGNCYPESMVGSGVVQFSGTSDDHYKEFSTSCNC